MPESYTLRRAATAPAQNSAVSSLLLLISSSVVKAATAHAQQNDQQPRESYTLKRAATAPAQQNGHQPVACSAQLTDPGCHSTCITEDSAACCFQSVPCSMIKAATAPAHAEGSADA